jgi:hypothetical protein
MCLALEDLTKGSRAQAVVSSHSASTLARVDPFQVRHFRLNPADRPARVRAIRLPVGQEEASKFVREAVRTYPELYFARLAVLGEGASEEGVLPRRFGNQRRSLPILPGKRTYLESAGMSQTCQRTNPLPREGLAARSGDYVCRSNSLNERR